jgi:phospholipase/carboxylesterase/glyoxalase family protein
MTNADQLAFLHRFVPASPSNPGVTLLLLHGTGGNEQDLLTLGQELLPGAALLSPRGRILENGMPRFFRRLAEGVFDLDDLKLQTDELARFVGAASSKYGFDAGKIVAVGYSNGANIAASVMLSHPGVLAGAILFRPMVPFTPPVSPDLRNVPVLLAAGRRDPVVVPEQTLALGEILKTSGARVSLHWHEGGHELGRDDIAAAKDWIHIEGRESLGQL